MAVDQYDFRRMLVLRAVAQTGSLTDAAKELRLTTSAVSQQVSKLEHEVGVPLLERGSRGVRVTEAGEVLVGHTEAMDRLMSAAKADMEDFAGLRRGRLRLAIFPTVGASLLPTFVTSFRAEYPDLELAIRSSRIAGLLEMIARRDVDLATLWDYPWMRLPKDEITVAPMMSDPTMVLLPDSHPLARKRSISLEELKDEKWVTRANHPVARVLDRICRDAGFEPDIAFAASDYPELSAMVAAGIGVAIAPRLAVLEPRSGVRVLAIKGNPAPRRIVIGWAKDQRPNAAMLAGVAMLRQAASAVSSGT